MTRILKAYGDALEGFDTQSGPALGQADISSQETYLRCVLLLVRLTGQYVARFLPQASHKHRTPPLLLIFMLVSDNVHAQSAKC